MSRASSVSKEILRTASKSLTKLVPCAAGRRCKKQRFPTFLEKRTFLLVISGGERERRSDWEHDSEILEIKLTARTQRSGRGRRGLTLHSITGNESEKLIFAHLNKVVEPKLKRGGD